jgi:endoglucanase
LALYKDTTIMTPRRHRLGNFAILLAATATTACGGSAFDGDDTDSTEAALCAHGEQKLFTPKPNQDAVKQIAKLKSKGERAAAARISAMIDQPQALWLTAGSPREVERQARQIVREAAGKKALPVLVAYNIPFRDCAQFSAGGATTKAEYLAWIDGLAKGIGQSDAVVVLEPDGLGIIPFYNPFADRDDWLTDPGQLEWCQPAEADPATAASERFEMLNYAVDALKARPNTRVYLDGTHTGWLGAGDSADRLLLAGVTRADGFFLNASNYQADDRLEKYGAWVSKCVWFADTTSGSWGGGHSEWCGSQYYPATSSDFSTWGLTDQWYVDNVESQELYPGADGTPHFVVDTSRNGVGPWQPTPVQIALGDVQDWCNPPDRGVGLRPTLNTENPLLDARLWIKIPGESDGQCNRWEPLGSPDPVRGMVDPAAGLWFPEMALELSENAAPPL